MYSHHRYFGRVIAVTAILMAGTSGAAELPKNKPIPVEPYIREPVPPFVQVVGTEVDGPLFADAAGHTLYTWPQEAQRGGDIGDPKDKPTCDDTRIETSSGATSPWPPGLILPDLDTRPTCAQLWPPVFADADAKPVGKWSIATRKDGRKQWAYDGYAVYTSSLDHVPGDIIGSGVLRAKGEAGTLRIPLGPKPDIPSQFKIATIPMGRMLTIGTGFSVYAWDKDGPNRSNCDEVCLRTWQPVLASETAPQSRGDWDVIERSRSVWQWTYRKKPLYTLIDDEQTRSFHGTDVPGWHNVYTQPAPAWPKGFTAQDNPGGQVLADAHGKTIYIYNCVDDALDQQSCDHPSLTQTYRLAVCGAFDPKRCVGVFPYVVADRNAQSSSRIWSIKDINPLTGRYVAPGEPGALRVWTYRDRPVYTFADEVAPGDASANSWGEGNGWRNGYHAFWVREEFRKQY